MILLDGFLVPSLNGVTMLSPAAPSRPPVPPPGMPTLPVTQASMKIARAVFSPLAWRCGPQPWVMAHGLAPAISRASWTMRASGMPVIADAHAGVFSTPSGPLPSM